MRQSYHISRQRGFTLIEMVVVISMILVLVGVAIPAYTRSITRARESALRQDLFTLRSVINQYTEDKEKAPQTLADLMSAGYLKQIPIDPITHSDSSWQVQQEEVLDSVYQDAGGITDVHSGSQLISSEGTPYSEW
jgi:general secretion pathway protein G